MMDKPANGATQLTFDVGTAYDLFASLGVLHHPGKFGLRGAWAAGVRSRLGAQERQTLETLVDILHTPYGWTHALPQPKDASTALFTLRQLPPRERLLRLSFSGEYSQATRDIFARVAERGAWQETDRRALEKAFDTWDDEEKTEALKKADKHFDTFAHADEYGEALLSALQNYVEVFFAEEEQRIRPKLVERAEYAEELSERLALPDLIEELSRGLRFEEAPEQEELVLVPSYWFTPLVGFEALGLRRMLLLFGARPQDESLVPGEIVPDDLLRALKALADPTRLRILRYLTQEHLTPAELARRLRLRAPTVIHHLHALRLAGLVRFMMKGKNERLYSARADAITIPYSMLKAFLEQDARESEPTVPLDRGRTF